MKDLHPSFRGSDVTRFEPTSPRARELPRVALEVKVLPAVQETQGHGFSPWVEKIP